jgi:hypothetical protein
MSFLLSWISWRWVEQPVRQSATWSRRRAFSFAFSGMAALSVLAGICLLNRCWTDRCHPKANSIAGQKTASVLSRWAYDSMPQKLLKSIIKNPEKYAEGKYRGDQLPIGDANAFGPQNGNGTFIIGDSHAGALKNDMNKWAEQEQKRIIILSYSASVMFDWSVEKNAQNILQVLEGEPSITRIVLVQIWSGQGMDRLEPQKLLRDFIEKMQALGKKVYIASDVAVLDGSIHVDRSVLARQEMFSPRFYRPEWEDLLHGQSLEKYEQMQGNVNSVLSEICMDTGATLIPLQKCLFLNGRHRFYSKDNGKMIAFYHDNHHLAAEGARLAIDFIMKYIANHESKQE